ncbi:MAG: archaeosortase/exosortase family protein [Geminicoccaceae bacterium]
MTLLAIAAWPAGRGLSAGLAAGLVAVVAMDVLFSSALADGLLQGHMPAIGLLELVTLGVAVRALWRAGETPVLASSITILAALMTLVPGAALGRAALALLGVGLIAGGEPSMRRPGVLLARLRVVLLLQAVGLKHVAGPILAAEAWGAAGLCNLLGMGVERTGNLIVHGDHRLAVLLGCSGLVNAGLGSLAYLALVPPDRPAIGGVLLVGAAMLLLNTVRLAGMATDPAWYPILHGTVGQVAADAIGMGIIVAALELRGDGA